MKALFIGGPKAGCVIDVQESRTFVQFPKLTPARAEFDPHQRGPSEPVTFDLVTYKLDYAYDKAGNRHVVYVEENSGDPLITLMNFYAEAKHP